MLFTAGSATSADANEEPHPEVTDKLILQKTADLLWRTANLFERHRNELMEAPHHQDGTAKLLPWLMLCAILSGFACALSLAAGVCCWWLAHEYHDCRMP